MFGRTEPELKVRAERLSPEDDSLNEEATGRLGDAEDLEIVFDVGNAGDAEVLNEHIDHTGRKETGQSGTDVDVFDAEIEEREEHMMAFCSYHAML